MKFCNNIIKCLLLIPQRDYGMPSLVPREWAALVDRFQSDDDLFQKYYRLVS